MEFRNGFRTDGAADAQLEKFYELVCSYNRNVNITAITEREEFFIKHVWDSIAGEKYFPAGAAVAEVGSGGGFPSIPLKIARPDLRFTQFESTGKKCAFLSEAAELLGIDKMTVVNRRAEEAGRMEDYRERFRVCCARAVARLNTLLEYCAPLVESGGIVVAYKGSCEEEIEEAGRAAEILGCRLITCDRYSLPGGMGERSLVVYKKIAATPPKYPRGQGKERKQPL